MFGWVIRFKDLKELHVNNSFDVSSLLKESFNVKIFLNIPIDLSFINIKQKHLIHELRYVESF